MFKIHYGCSNPRITQWISFLDHYDTLIRFNVLFSQHALDNTPVGQHFWSVHSLDLILHTLTRSSRSYTRAEDMLCTSVATNRRIESHCMGRKIWRTKYLTGLCLNYNITTIYYYWLRPLLLITSTAFSAFWQCDKTCDFCTNIFLYVWIHLWMMLLVRWLQVSFTNRNTCASRKQWGSLFLGIRDAVFWSPIKSSSPCHLKQYTGFDRKSITKWTSWTQWKRLPYAHNIQQ